MLRVQKLKYPILVGILVAMFIQVETSTANPLLANISRAPDGWTRVKDLPPSKDPNLLMWMRDPGPAGLKITGRRQKLGNQPIVVVKISSYRAEPATINWCFQLRGKKNAIDTCGTKTVNLPREEPLPVNLRIKNKLFKQLQGELSKRKSVKLTISAEMQPTPADQQFDKSQSWRDQAEVVITK